MSPDAFDDTLYRKRGGGRAIFVALFALLAAGGLGYVSYILWNQRSLLEGELKERFQEIAACATELKQRVEADTALHKRAEEYKTAAEECQQKQESDEGVLEGLEANLNATRTELEELRRQRAETKKRLEAFENLTAKLKRMIDTGTLKVRHRRGQMLVELPAEVLFPSASAELSKKGRRALLEVGFILKQFPDRRFMIAGHTDDQPLRGSRYRNNWELSTARAVVVTELLLEEVGLSGENLVAAGYGAFDPVASNDSKEGRQANRRIEIVLLPDLPELPRAPAGAVKEKERDPKRSGE